MQNLKKYLLLDSGLVVGYTLENAQLKLNKLKKDTENNPLKTIHYLVKSILPKILNYGKFVLIIHIQTLSMIKN
ncbi:hypothetical protein CWI17_10670 [Streptococcus pneumoniae]|nr:hypothetical protein CWI19_10210 [Streptococcus pneumoniae]RRR02305.1 hypothetical protein CWI17_10670 [Streptococcus pneumoniae]RRR08475.1 hypothetical protein CWI14_04625 [Streptococcus pneumoniae]RRR98859.1 hypothetical protein CWI01_01195 [Streptococcus pneumoniae]